jgi:hypothetical protein
VGRSEDGDEPGAGGEEPGDQPSSGAGENEGSQEGAGEGAADAIERAIGAMRESEGALGRGDLSASREAQTEAIQALRDAGDAIASEMAAQNEQDAEGTDPLGRGLDGMDSDNAQSDLDTRDNAERSREILEELRRRAADAERDQQEQDYLDRLLKRF